MPPFPLPFPDLVNSCLYFSCLLKCPISGQPALSLDSSVLLGLGSQSILSFSITAGSWWSYLLIYMVIKLAQCFL